MTIRELEQTETEQLQAQLEQTQWTLTSAYDLIAGLREVAETYEQAIDVAIALSMQKGEPQAQLRAICGKLMQALTRANLSRPATQNRS